MSSTDVQRTHARGPGLWPREHGAYVELAAPLISALAWSRSLAGVLLSIAACCSFVAHEALVVWLGLRGARTQARLAGKARTRVALLLTVAAIALGAALVHMPAPARTWLLPCAALGLACVALLALGFERTRLGECVVACTFASLVVPVSMSGGVSLHAAALLAGAWALANMLATFTGHGAVHARRDGGRGLRDAATLAVTIGTICVAALMADLAPTALALVPMPFVVLGMFCGARSEYWRMTKPIQVGWALVGATVCSLCLALSAAPPP